MSLMSVSPAAVTNVVAIANGTTTDASGFIPPTPATATVDALLHTGTTNGIGFAQLAAWNNTTLNINGNTGSDSITVNGQDPRNNNYMLDGANNNDDVIGQRAGTQARTPIEAVQEFQVVTNQFDAEFGRTNGAIINDPSPSISGTSAWMS